MILLKLHWFLKLYNLIFSIYADDTSCWPFPTFAPVLRECRYWKYIFFQPKIKLKTIINKKSITVHPVGSFLDSASFSPSFLTSHFNFPAKRVLWRQTDFFSDFFKIRCYFKPHVTHSFLPSCSTFALLLYFFLFTLNECVKLQFADGTTTTTTTTNKNNNINNNYIKKYFSFWKLPLRYVLFLQKYL